MFVPRPSAGGGLHLVRTARGSFAGDAGFLRDPGNRDRVGEYLADLAAPYGLKVSADLCGQSYGDRRVTSQNTTRPPGLRWPPLKVNR